MRNRPNPAKREPRFYTPERKRHRVIAARIAGKSYREIAKAEGLNRETVGRILSTGEAKEMMGAARSVLQQKLPELARKMLSIALRGKGDRQAITDIFRGLRAPNFNRSITAALERLPLRRGESPAELPKGLNLKIVRL